MSSITISNLPPAGLSLFSDSEGYLNDLDDREQTIQGGMPIWWLGAATATIGAFTVGFAGAALYYSGAKCTI